MAGGRGDRADRALALLPATTHKTRIVDVVYNASNNELVRTKTLVKNAIVQIDATCVPPARFRSAPKPPPFVGYDFSGDECACMYARGLSACPWRRTGRSTSAA